MDLLPNPAELIDQTLLQPTATAGQIEALCEEAVEYGFATVCIPPVFVPLAVKCLYGSTVGVCSVVGFPCGYSRSRQKVQEAADLVAAGAIEVDMVIALGSLLEGRLAQVEEEIAQVVLAAREGRVKVILECCYLTDQLITQATEAAVRAGAAFVKTSTGFGPAGAAVADVQSMVTAAAGRIKVKAAGGIRTFDQYLQFVAAGAERIGTSAGTSIVKEWLARCV